MAAMYEYQCFWKDYTEITLLDGDEELEKIREFEKMWPEQPNKKNRGLFSCKVCGEHFESQSYSYRAHYRVHMGVYPYKCLLCGFGTHERPVSLLHFRDDHYNYKANNYMKQAESDDCSLRESTRDENFVASEWKDHVQHNAMSVEDEMHQIMLLGIEIPPLEEKPAITLKFVGPSYTCNLCNTTVNKEVTLIAHYRIHTGYKPYECKLCHESGANREWMRNHFRTNHVKGGGKTSTEPALVGSARWQMLIIDNDQRFDASDVFHMSCVFANVTDGLSRVCVICKTKQINIKGHYLTAHCDRHFSCRVCHKTNRDKLGIKSHVEFYHRNLLNTVVSGSFEESEIPHLIKNAPITRTVPVKRIKMKYKKPVFIVNPKRLAGAKAVRKALKGQRKLPATLKTQGNSIIAVKRQRDRVSAVEGRRNINTITAESRLDFLLAAHHVAETSVARAIPIEELVEYKPEPDQSIREVSRPELSWVEVCHPVWSKTPITPEYNEVSFIGLDRWQVVGGKRAPKRARVSTHFTTGKAKKASKKAPPEPADRFPRQPLSYQPPAEVEDLFGPPEVKEVTRKLVPFGRPLLNSPMKKGQNTITIHRKPAVYEQPASLRMGGINRSASNPVLPQSLDDIMNGLGSLVEQKPATTNFQLPNLQQLFPNGISLPNSAGPPAFILVVAPEPKHT